MRPSTVILSLTLSTPLLLSCGKQEPIVDVDPEVGRACYEAHLASLPDGTQYEEGIEGAAGDRLTIRVMTGVELTTVECRLNPDGTLQGVAQ